MKLQAFVGLFVIFAVYSPKVSAVTVTECEPGHGYPDFCPQPGDAPNRTRCCKYYLTPSCCEERATTMCVWSDSRRWSGKISEPGESDHAVFCPQPGQSDDNTVCCTNNNEHYCCSTKLLAAILGGVFGSLALIGVVVGIVCCVQVRSGRWVCVQVRPGKWTMVSRKRAEKLNHMRQLELNANRTRPPQRCRRPCPFDKRDCTAADCPVQRCCGSQCPYAAGPVPGPSYAPPGSPYAPPGSPYAPPPYPDTIAEESSFSNSGYQCHASVGPGGEKC